jgi:hypothetical protein
LVDGEKPGVERALDALNFFLADVRDGLGPYLAIYLLTEQKWDEASIGIVMSVAALAGIIAQTPAGALIDRSTAKRALMVTAAILVTLSCIALPLIHRFELVRGNAGDRGGCRRDFRACGSGRDARDRRPARLCPPYRPQ